MQIKITLRFYLTPAKMAVKHITNTGKDEGEGTFYIQVVGK